MKVSAGVAHDESVRIVTAAQRPDLWESADQAFDGVWPEYNLHGNDCGEYFGALIPQHAKFQVLVYDLDTEAVLARGRSIPFRWDFSLDDLPAGIDAVGHRGVTDPRPPTALSALAAEVVAGHQGRGLSRLVIKGLSAAARCAGLETLVAPVRPTWKDRYPLTPIKQYARWQRSDGLPFDPWMRVHARLGATTIRTEARSMRIEAPVADWEAWTRMRFPQSGRYVFPAGLAPLEVRDGVGRYWEPNVWMLHPAVLVGQASS